MDEQELSELIARDLFATGSEPSRGVAGIVQRIEFKGGEYPDDETELGGLCEKSLARRIRSILVSARDESGQDS